MEGKKLEETEEINEGENYCRIIAQRRKTNANIWNREASRRKGQENRTRQQKMESLSGRNGGKVKKKRERERNEGRGPQTEKRGN